MIRCLRGALAALLLAPVPGARVPAARPGYTFRFPYDHGAHPGTRSEWWYFTGHLWSPGGQRRYGYQLTFFREALPAAGWTGSTAWRSDQILLAHAALTDVAAGRFRTEERLNRQGLAAGAAEGRLDLRDASWSARMDSAGHIRLDFSVGAQDLRLDLEPGAGPVVFDREGGDRAGHYLSFPRLATHGDLRGRAGTESLQGSSWMDHEFSSSQLPDAQVGWDWAGIQLRDGRSLMLYRWRGAGGAQDPGSALTEVAADGRITRTIGDFRLSGGSWRNPAGVRYPLPLTLEAWGQRWVLEPLVADQEWHGRLGPAITYWEGACRVRDAAGNPVGDAYVELTGYAHSMQGRF
jgi:predicted secreted hydrolase